METKYYLALAIIIAVELSTVAASLSQVKSDEHKPTLETQSLVNFLKSKTNIGWKIRAIPESFKPSEAIVMAKGNLDSLTEQEEVCITYSWVVISTVTVDPGTKKRVSFLFKTVDTAESIFRVKSPAKLEFTLDVSKTKCLEEEGTTITSMVEAGKQETKLVVSLQQIIQVYSSQKPSRLLATGYLRKYGTAELVK